MSKPWLFRAGAAWDWLLGRERYGRLVRRLCLAKFREEPLRAIVERLLRRVHGRLGRPLPPGELVRLIDRLAEHYARTQHNLFICDQDIGPLLETVELSLLPALARLRLQGRGVLLVTPHFGNIGLAMVALAEAGIPLNTQVINAEDYRWAERKGLRFIGLSSGAMECVRALGRNEAVLIYGDLDFFPEGRTAEFFGAPVRPPHGAARLALAARCPVLPVYAVFTPAGTRFECDAPIPVGPRTPEQAIEARLLRSMERWIARYPDQWLVCKDIWDIPATDAMLKYHLNLVRGALPWTQRFRKRM